MYNSCIVLCRDWTCLFSVGRSLLLLIRFCPPKSCLILCACWGLSTCRFSSKNWLSRCPTQNDLQELYTLLDLANPGLLGTSAHFCKVWKRSVLVPHLSFQHLSAHVHVVYGDRRGVLIRLPLTVAAVSCNIWYRSTWLNMFYMVGSLSMPRMFEWFPVITETVCSFPGCSILRVLF